MENPWHRRRSGSLIQNGVIVIPKSVHKSRMEENFNVFDFTMTEEEMKRIEALDTGESLFFSHYDRKLWSGL